MVKNIKTVSNSFVNTMDERERPFHLMLPTTAMTEKNVHFKTYFVIHGMTWLSFFMTV
jgi:hypothetical protein